MSDFQESLNTFARDIAATRDERNIERAVQETGAELITRQRVEAASLLQPTLDRNKLAWDGLRRVLPADPDTTKFDSSHRQLRFYGSAALLDPKSRQQIPVNVAVTTGLAETPENETWLQEYYKARRSRFFGHKKRVERATQPLLGAELSSCDVLLTAKVEPNQPYEGDNIRQTTHTLTRVALPLALTSDNEFERGHTHQYNVKAMVEATYLHDKPDSWGTLAAQQTQATYEVTPWLQGVTWERNARAASSRYY